MNKREVWNLLFRYILLILIAIPNLWIIYKIFTPLTLYLSFFILKLLGSTTLQLPSIILFKDSVIMLIPACIAGSAYYLLLLLNLTTPMKTNKRIRSITFLLLTFLIINVIRIVIFAVLATNNFSYFNLTHEIIWYGGSTILVVALWFVNVWIFKIKEIPIYSDFNKIYKDTKN